MRQIRKLRKKLGFCSFCGGKKGIFCDTVRCAKISRFYKKKLEFIPDVDLTVGILGTGHMFKR